MSEFGYIPESPEQSFGNNKGIFTPTDIYDLTRADKYTNYGQLELIETLTASGTATTLNFTNIKQDIYNVHFLTISDVFFSGTNVLTRLRLSNNGGTSFISSGYQYAYQSGNNAGTFNENKSTSDSYINLIQNTGNEATEVTNAYVYFYNLGDSSKYSFLTYHFSGMSSAGTNYQMGFGSAVLPTAEVHNSFQLIDGLLTRNINAKCSLYGIKEYS
tara:strand:- start:19 stop:666 length:648 start_codon:yes stop_codon:yes gene_type:complete